jgi:sec-independent protein translocase protein TatA
MGVLGLFGLPGYWEVIIIVLAILLLFGGKKLPELARGLGKGLRIFRGELKGIQEDLEAEPETEEHPPAAEEPKPEAPAESREAEEQK